MSLLSTLKRVFYDSRDYVFFAWTQSRPTKRPDLPHGFELDHFISHKEAPRGLALGTSIAPGPLGLPGNVMAIRMRRGHATLLVLHRGGKVAAYGWLQSWRLFKDKFGPIAQNAVMLGPYYTAPDYRGQGLYGILLAESLRLAPLDKLPVIFTTPDNQPSLRGIEKAGFKPLGNWRISGWLQRFWKASAIAGAQ